LRRDARVITAGIAWLLTFLLMTVIFPYQGGRGGFFHSGAALQIVFWVAAPLGLEAIVAWVGRLRRWDIPRAQRFFSFGLVGLAILLTGLVVPSRIFGSGRGQIAWNESYQKYLQVEQGLLALGASTGEIVLVNNPPGYFIASGRPSIAIPFGDVETLLDVASRYQADYLLLEFNQLQGPDDLYNRPGDRSGLQYLDTVADVRIYRITSP
jgi:hypothetical protein